MPGGRLGKGYQNIRFLELVLWLPFGEPQSSDGTESQGSKAFLSAKIVQERDLSLADFHFVFFSLCAKRESLGRIWASNPGIHGPGTW